LSGASFPKEKKEVPGAKEGKGKSSRQLGFEQKKCKKPWSFFCRKWHNRPFGAGKASATLAKYRK